MALSNWDTFSINHKGEVTNGEFNSVNEKISIEVYKNWIHITDERAWTKSSNLIKPIVSDLHSGNLSYNGIEIRAIRGPKEGIYCVIWEFENREDDKRSWHDEKYLNSMIAIGCYGYKDTAYEYFKDNNMLKMYNETDDWYTSTTYTNKKTKITLESFSLKKKIELTQEQYDEYSDWCGIEGEEIKYLAKFINDYKDTIPETILNLDLYKGQTFNQGDKYFSENLFGQDYHQDIGSKEKPIIEGMIKNIK